MFQFPTPPPVMPGQGPGLGSLATLLSTMPKAQPTQPVPGPAQPATPAPSAVQEPLNLGIEQQRLLQGLQDNRMSALREPPVRSWGTLGLSAANTLARHLRQNQLFGRLQNLSQQQ